MTGDHPADQASAAAEDVNGASLGAQAPPWLLSQKVAVPDPVDGYTDRSELVERAMPTRRRLTVLMAPGGFGKTTLLAECCRRLRRDGTAVAWVSLDEGDEPSVLDAYVAHACALAGVNLEAPKGEDAPDGPRSRIEALVGRIKSSGQPVVLALDEVERLGHPGSAALVALLLRRGPPNLHLAIACRDIPDGLDLTGALLEGDAEVVGTEDLRFSAAETARFFGLRLSRRALAEEMDRCAGWPFAMRISLISMERGASARADIGPAFVGSWIESRLFAGLDRDGRDFVLDLGLLDWFDRALLDEVLQRVDLTRRLESLADLAGLIEQVGGRDSKVRRLHPLLREHCANQRLQEDPERTGTVHRRTAGALARRGMTVMAMRHAVEGGDPFLAGRILERAGGVRLWIHQGVTQLQAAHRLLDEAVISESPRLKLLSSAVLVLSGKPLEGRALYRQCVHRDLNGKRAEHFEEELIVRGCMALYAGEPMGSDWMQAFRQDLAQLEGSSSRDPLTRGHIEYTFGVLHFQQGEFGRTVERLALASDLLAGDRNVALYGELMRGQIEFLRGRAPAAEPHFRKSQRIARTHQSHDPVAVASVRIAMKEMALECDPASAPTEHPGLRRALMTIGVPYSFFATAANVLVDSGLLAGRIDRTLALADEVLRHLRRVGLTSCARLMAGLRVSLLSRLGRTQDADRAYRQEELPEDPAGCVDLATQNLREMEAVSEARVRLLAAQGQFGDARSLLSKLRSLAADRRFRRLEMRVLALSVMVERQAGRAEASLHGLREYLDLFAGSPFAWPLVREWTTCAEPVRRFLELNPESPHEQAARSLLAAMRHMGGGPGSEPALSEREREVLSLLPGRRVKEVAASLGLSVHGVRFHLRKLFTKLQVSNQAQLLRRARELGLLARDA